MATQWWGWWDDPPRGNAIAGRPHRVSPHRQREDGVSGMSPPRGNAMAGLVRAWCGARSSNAMAGLVRACGTRTRRAPRSDAMEGSVV